MSRCYMRVYLELPPPERFRLLWTGCNEVPRVGDQVSIGKGLDEVAYTVLRVVWPIDGDVVSEGRESVDLIVRSGGAI